MLMPLLVGTGVMLGSLLLYSMATHLIVRLSVRLIRSGFTGLGFWKSVAVMMIVTLITAAAHLGPITLWAVALLMLGEISTFEPRFLSLRGELHGARLRRHSPVRAVAAPGPARGHQRPPAVRPVDGRHVRGDEPPDHEPPSHRPSRAGGRQPGAHSAGRWQWVQVNKRVPILQTLSTREVTP